MNLVVGGSIRGDRTMLDPFIPAPHLVELDFIDVAAPPERAYEVVRHFDASRAPIIRALTIRTLAAFGKVIIVGRGGVCLTRELPHGIHVRLVAASSSRVRRMMELLHLPEGEARKVVAEMDRSRARLLKTSFSKDIGDPLLYDVIWNTDSVSIEEISSSIIGLIQSRAEEAAAVARFWAGDGS